MEDVGKKLRVLLPHWIEHNNGHEQDSLQWAGIAREEGMTAVASAIEEAVQAMREVNRHFERALTEAGGALEDGHHHHH